ncbi:hypothetical protein D3C76_1722480 [compost metagenome]
MVKWQLLQGLCDIDTAFHHGHVLLVEYRPEQFGNHRAGGWLQLIGLDDGAVASGNDRHQGRHDEGERKVPGAQQ